MASNGLENIGLALATYAGGVALEEKTLTKFLKRRTRVLDFFSEELHEFLARPGLIEKLDNSGASAAEQGSVNAIFLTGFKNH